MGAPVGTKTKMNKELRLQEQSGIAFNKESDRREDTLGCGQATTKSFDSFFFFEEFDCRTRLVASA